MTSPSSFADLDFYVALPRLTNLALSPDGARLVTSVETLNPKKTGYVSALWEVDPTGVLPARRLTRSRKGESSPVFTDRGDLLFTSRRPDSDDDSDDDGPATLWLLPADGSEARVVCRRPGGVGVVRTAGEVIMLEADVLANASDEADESRIRAARKETKVAAILHSSYPVRFWDHDVGPGVIRLLAAPIPSAPTQAGDQVDQLELRQLTPDARPFDVWGADLASDGSFAVFTWQPMGEKAARVARLERAEIATGERTVVLDLPETNLTEPVISPDGSAVAYTQVDPYTPQRAAYSVLSVVELSTGDHRAVAPDWDQQPAEYRWTPDGKTLVVAADEDGRAPVFAVDVASGRVIRVTSDAAAFSDLQVSPDGATVYALRSSYLGPPAPVRIDLAAALASGEPVAAVALRGPAAEPVLPGRLEEVETTADDGVRIRSWLALPADASPEKPAPVLLWVHGGPVNSWNKWNWRWCPWIMVAHGYAVLLPDPALSTGYGREFIQRGWNAWGNRPYTDVMAAFDAVVARPDIDSTRTAAMGGSFGGYIANWIAGHTDRFQAIVTHASLWSLDQFGPTTDAAIFWRREMDEAMTAGHSPHRFVSEIATPMLVTHGDLDYRVPIGEALRLWYELLTHSALATDDEGRSPHRFLYFPDENHWILAPQNAKVWYQVVLVFLAEHVLGESGVLPETLGVPAISP
jgi:dipeptidyl aminopeptidase/acylaminoacyl peptidase